MAGDTELRELAHRPARKQLGQVRPNDAGEQHKRFAPPGQPFGQFDHTRQHARDLEDGDLVVAPESVLATQVKNEVERFVGHLRQRVGRVDAHRHQQGLDLAVEISLHPAALGLGSLAVREDANALFLEGRQQHMVVEPVLLIDHFTGPVDDARQLPRQMVAVARRERGLHVRCNADFKKFVEVGRDDAQVTQALQQRHFLAARPVQHTLIEGQDAQVTVEQGRTANRQFTGKNGWARHGHIRQEVNSMTDCGDWL